MDIQFSAGLKFVLTILLEFSSNKSDFFSISRNEEVDIISWIN